MRSAGRDAHGLEAEDDRGVARRDDLAVVPFKVGQEGDLEGRGSRTEGADDLGDALRVLPCRARALCIVAVGGYVDLDAVEPRRESDRRELRASDAARGEQ